MSSDLPSDFNWLAPDYTPIYRARINRLEKLRSSPELITALCSYYSKHFGEFINDWGSTYDPRLIPKGREPVTPFLLFPRQREFIQWIYERWLAGERGLAEKSRGVGFTWLAAGIAVALWRFYPLSVVGFGSRKEELVDNGDDPDSIFWKVRKTVELLPKEFWPAGFDLKRHSRHMKLINPENGAIIKGEIGDEIGRGGRTTMTFVDEAAFLAHPDLAEGALSETTDCRIDISTINQPGDTFYNNKHTLPPHQVFEFDWTDDPRKRADPTIPEEEEVWYKKKLAEIGPVQFGKEVLRNYDAAITNTYIPALLIDEANQRRKSSIIQADDTPWTIGVDAARMGNDESVIHARRGRLNRPQIVKRKLKGYELAGIITDLCTELLVIAPIASIVLELDGPGVAALEALEQSSYGSIVVGVHTGAKLKDGRNFNIRAWLHRQAKEYLENESPYILRDPVFKRQATSFLYSFRGGSLLIESKDEYRTRFSQGRTRVAKMSGPSPDRWDAFVLSFAPARAAPVEVEKNEIFMPFDREFAY